MGALWACSLAGTWRTGTPATGNLRPPVWITCFSRVIKLKRCFPGCASPPSTLVENWCAAALRATSCSPWRRIRSVSVRYVNGDDVTLSWLLRSLTQEYVVMNLDSRLLSFPLYVCCNFLYTSPHTDQRPDSSEQENATHVSWCGLGEGHVHWCLTKDRAALNTTMENLPGSRYHPSDYGNTPKTQTDRLYWRHEGMLPGLRSCFIGESKPESYSASFSLYRSFTLDTSVCFFIASF